MDDVADGVEAELLELLLEELVPLLEELESSLDEDPLVVVVVVVALTPVEAVLLFVVVVAPDVAAALEPGCSLAIATAITAVAPVAATTAPFVRLRTQDCALALFSRLFCSGERDMDRQPLLGDVTITPRPIRHPLGTR